MLLIPIRSLPILCFVFPGMMIGKRWNHQQQGEQGIESNKSSTTSTSWWKPYYVLTKPRLSGLVIITTMLSYGLAPGSFEILPFLGSAVGTSLAVVSAQTWNQLIEIDRDRRMVRTENRPLPTGVISKRNAVIFGVANVVAGGALLLATCPFTSFALAMANVGLYSIVYTHLKVITPLNTYVGAVVGAIPPVIGWVAKTGKKKFGEGFPFSLSSFTQGTVGGGALALGLLLYLWQMPHFHALAYNLRDDYLRGGYKMLAVTNLPGLAKNAFAHSLAMIPLGALFAYTGITDWSFAVTSLVPTVYLASRAWAFVRNTNSTTSHALFLSTIRVLPLYLLLSMAHHYLLT